MTCHFRYGMQTTAYSVPASLNINITMCISPYTYMRTPTWKNLLVFAPPLKTLMLHVQWRNHWTTTFWSFINKCECKTRLYTHSEANMSGACLCHSSRVLWVVASTLLCDCYSGCLLAQVKIWSLLQYLHVFHRLRPQSVACLKMIKTSNWLVCILVRW